MAATILTGKQKPRSEITLKAYCALVEFSSIVSVIALLISLLSAWYTRQGGFA